MEGKVNKNQWISTRTKLSCLCTELLELSIGAPLAKLIRSVSRKRPPRKGLESLNCFLDQNGYCQTSERQRRIFLFVSLCTWAAFTEKVPPPERVKMDSMESFGRETGGPEVTPAWFELSTATT